MPSSRRRFVGFAVAALTAIATPALPQAIDSDKIDFYETLKGHKRAYANAMASYKEKSVSILRRINYLAQTAIPLGQDDMNFLRDVAGYFSHYPSFECGKMFAEAQHVERTTDEFNKSVKSEGDDGKVLSDMQRLAEGKYSQAVECMVSLGELVDVLNVKVRKIEEKKGISRRI